MRRYSFHIYFAYCVVLYTIVGSFQVYDPELVLRVYYGDMQPLTAGGVYFARHAGALAVVIAINAGGQCIVRLTFVSRRSWRC